MHPVRPFRVSLYLMLGLAILAVGVAGGDLLPEIPYMTMFALVLLGIAYRIEGRWELSLRQANIVGFVLFALLVLWGVYQTIRPATGLMDMLPWPASALPYMAPVVMILIPAKMLRPKHVGDFWAMQGMGVLAMALACAMTSEGLFVLLFALYALVFTWNLATFFLYRETGHDDARPVTLAKPSWSEARRLAQWAVVACLVAVPLFWVTPRGNTAWELGINLRGRASTGIGDGPVDLNRTGTIDVVRDKVFEVYVTDAKGEPYTVLPFDQRWRTGQLQQYEAGRWSRTQFGGISIVDRAVSPAGGADELLDWSPTFGPDTVRMKYQLYPAAQRTLPLADPIMWQTGVYSPVVSRTNTGKFRNWVHHQDGTFDGIAGVENETRTYLQSWSSPKHSGYGPAMRVDLTLADRLGLARLPRDLPRTKEYADNVLKQAVEQGQLPAVALAEADSVTRGRMRQYHEPIARVLEQHLANNPDFSYTLELKRSNRTIDPTEDFLFNVKAGHCQRYATALVMLLRSQGITAQLVLGYRGCEGRGDGWYDVYSSHAHAWVEVLVPAPEAQLPPLIDRITNQVREGPWVPMRWVTLDPTPGGTDDTSAVATSFLEQAKQRWEALFRLFVLAYNAESRDDALAAMQTWFLDDGGLYKVVAFVGVIVGLYWLRRYWKHWRTTPSSGLPEAVRRLMAAFAKHGLARAQGQTVREYFVHAVTILKLDATVPMQVLHAYYGESFGAHPITPEQHTQLNKDVQGFLKAWA